MNTKTKYGCRRLLAMLLVVISVMGLIAVPAFAGQEDGYHDPAERWMNASNRTNELDVNATVTHETFHCYICKQPTSFQVWRTPEYTKDGQTAMIRNIRYSDGTLLGGTGTGTILDGTPGVNATYTGYHWTKACCETCGTMNANLGLSDYALSKNVYWLYDCATAFTEYLDDVVTYEYADSTYHKKIVDGGSYCEFCYGTRHTHSETLEPHDLHVDIIPQLGHQRFAIVKHCHDCEYASYNFVAAKAVVADYYGVVDGQAHTLVISDLSDAGVTAKIRYGNTAETCTMTTPPSYTEEGQYTVYYQIDYTYQGVGMTENGVAYVWLRDDSLPELPAGPGCTCGCGDPDCDCEHGHCPHCEGHDCTKGDHNFILIDTVKPTCESLGYDRYKRFVDKSVGGMVKRPVWKYVMPVAACLVLMVGVYFAYPKLSPAQLPAPNQDGTIEQGDEPETYPEQTTPYPDNSGNIDIAPEPMPIEPGGTINGFGFYGYDNQTEILNMKPMITGYGENSGSTDIAVNNGHVFFSESLTSAMEEYSDTANYRVLIDLFQDGVQISINSETANQEVQRLIDMGIIVAMETVKHEDNHGDYVTVTTDYYLTLHATYEQLKDFLPSDNLGYSFMLYDEYFGPSPAGELVVFNGYSPTN